MYNQHTTVTQTEHTHLSHSQDQAWPNDSENIDQMPGRRDQEKEWEDEEEEEWFGRGGWECLIEPGFPVFPPHSSVLVSLFTFPCLPLLPHSLSLSPISPPYIQVGSSSPLRL